MTPSVSVLLPVYNGERFLKECISSVLRQSHTSFELLIADDASVDRSREIIGAFADPRIKVTCLRANGGLFKALNYLLAQAAAPVVHFLCQDDVLVENCLAAEAEVFAEHPDVTVSFCKAFLIDAHGRTTGATGVKGESKRLEPRVALQLFYYYGCFADNLSTVAVRRDVAVALGGFDVSFRVGGDYDMWVRVCAQGGSLAIIQERLVRLRDHSRRLSADPASGVYGIAEDRRIRAVLLDFLPGEIRTWARWYMFLRQNVLNTHHCLHCLVRGRVADVAAIVKIMGVRDLLLGLLGWIVTGMNRLWQPRPRFLPACAWRHGDY